MAEKILGSMLVQRPAFDQASPRTVVAPPSALFPIRRYHSPSQLLTCVHPCNRWQQGQGAVQGQLGSGSVVAGYRRQLTPRDSLEVSAVLGLKHVLSVTSSRQLSQYTSASLSATYSAADGLGLQVGDSWRSLWRCCTYHVCRNLIRVRQQRNIDR